MTSFFEQNLQATPQNMLTFGAPFKHCQATPTDPLNRADPTLPPNVHMYILSGRVGPLLLKGSEGVAWQFLKVAPKVNMFWKVACKVSSKKNHQQILFKKEVTNIVRPTTTWQTTHISMTFLAANIFPNASSLASYI